MDREQMDRGIRAPSADPRAARIVAEATRRLESPPALSQGYGTLRQAEDVLRAIDRRAETQRRGRPR